jgi:murein DD-endopeptidase MepM/ murein hydrolase activator NlpD
MAPFLCALAFAAHADAGPPPAPPPAYAFVTERVGQRTAGELLDALGVDGRVAHQLIAATRKTKGRKGGIDYRRLRPRDLISLRTQNGNIDFIEVRREYATEAPDVWRADRSAEGFEVRQVAFAVDHKLARVSGTIKATLYDTMIGLGEFPVLINHYADLFAWQVDFYRETQVGDRFTVLVEKLYLEGVFVGYGRIFSGIYDSKVHGELVAFRRPHPKGGYAVYDRKGRSMERAFLRTPLEVSRITSSYGMRFHPVLGRRKRHNGVDYGASTGTKTWAVARGRVKYAAWAGASGKLVIISHINGYETIYAHLSRILVRKGQRVAQRQVIGRVGTTGRSTGPHLHFGMKKNGRYVDPLRQKFAKGAPLSKRKLPAFLKRVKAELPILSGARPLPEQADWLEAKL